MCVALGSMLDVPLGYIPYHASITAQHNDSADPPAVARADYSATKNFLRRTDCAELGQGGDPLYCGAVRS